MALENHHVGAEPVWVLTDYAGARLVVARTGATALSWQVPGPNGEMVEVLDGYRDDAELREADGYRNSLLAPWSNRLRDFRFTWRGREHDVSAIADREALHGLVCHVPWELIEGEEQDRLEAWTSVAPTDGYPYPLQVRAAYTLGRDDDGAHRLTLDLTALNVSDEEAPVGLGWHPYVRLGASLDDLTLTIPGATHVVTDAALLPPDGPEAFEPATPTFAPLLGHQLDDAWTDLNPGADGIVRTVLSAPDGASVTLEQPATACIVHVFTGDALARDRRASIALEPCEHMTNAFNRPELADEVALGPGQRRTLTAALVYRR